MPNGLPKQLLTLLGSITSNNKVNNWCIYENRSNQTCVTIRFSDCEAIKPGAQFYMKCECGTF